MNDMAARGKIGGYASELTKAARHGFLKRFEPTDIGLSPEEFTRRTQANLKMHMAQLARKSALVRRRE
jgi:hypothetical protein